MTDTINLAVDVQADAARIFETLTTSEGQRAFWTIDCDVADDTARFGFPIAPVDLLTTVIKETNKLVRMTVTSGFPFWDGSTWEWKLGEATRADSGTGILFRHSGFGDGYAEIDLAHTAQTWALILDRLAAYANTGVANPLFGAT